MDVTEKLLTELQRLSELADPAPWTAWYEGRDHLAGSDFIMAGPPGDRRDDMYVSRDSGRVGAAELDLIAAARTHLPTLIAEIRALRGQIAGDVQGDGSDDEFARRTGSTGPSAEGQDRLSLEGGYVAAVRMAESFMRREGTDSLSGYLEYLNSDTARWTDWLEAISRGLQS